MCFTDEYQAKLTIVVFGHFCFCFGCYTSLAVSFPDERKSRKELWTQRIRSDVYFRLCVYNKVLVAFVFCLRLQKDKGSLTNLIVQNKQSSVTISIILSKNDLNKDWLLQWQKILIGYILDRKSNSRSEINFWLKQYPSLFSFAGSIPIYLYSKYNNVKIRTLFKRSFMKFEISKLLNYWFVILNIFNLSYPNQILTLFLVYMYWSYYKVNVIAWILLAICFLYFVI